MSKIILCSDGTGNKGGYGADSNVFRLYNAIDLGGPGETQITFYDNGVGTQSNKIIRALSGAFGFGFQSNVRDLYEFLARNYAPGDEIFLFGFSRGAATVRAFAGMVQECGLLHVKADRRTIFDEDEFERLIDDAMDGYEKHWNDLSKTYDSSATADFKRRVEEAGDFDLKDPVPITMIGVWDTVSALGFPQDWSWLLEKVFAGVDIVSDWVFPHRFYNYQLNENVANAYHAIAIDDERTTFHPRIWREFADKERDKNRDFERPASIEQVWFPGVHSNVGGGYSRAGMSYVTLDWMMERAERHGIRFHDEARDDVRDAANVHGKLYDSRDGVAVYYRYAPRFIDEMSEKYIEGPVNIHRSAIDRLERFTAGYAPTGLPVEFQIAHTELGVGNVSVPAPEDDAKADWERSRKAIKGYRYRSFEETLDADQNRGLNHRLERSDIRDRPQHRIFLGIVNGHHDRNRLARIPGLLQDLFHRHGMVFQTRRDVGEDTGFVDDHKPHVVGPDVTPHRQGRRFAQGFGRRAESGNPVAARNVDDIGDDGRCGRSRPGASALVNGVVDEVALHDDPVENTGDVIDRCVYRHHAGVYPLLDPVTSSVGHAQKLDPISEAPGKFDIDRRQVPDSLDINGVEIDFRSEGDAGQNG